MENCLAKTLSINDNDSFLEKLSVTWHSQQEGYCSSEEWRESQEAGRLIIQVLPGGRSDFMNIIEHSYL